MANKDISKFKRFLIWKNTKISNILFKRSKSADYLALERGVLTIFMDSLTLFLSLLYFIFPGAITLFISLGFISFNIKKIFPNILKLLNSITLVKVGK